MHFDTPFKEQLLLIVTLIGILQGVVLAAIVHFYPERDKNANNLLSLFIFSATLILLAPLIQFIIGWTHVWILHSIKFITVASLYLYIKSLSEQVTFRNSWKHFLIVPLYAPVAYHYVHYISHKYQVDHTYAGAQDPYDYVISFSTLLYLLFYLYLYWRAYQDHKKKVEKNFSHTHRLGLTWIKQLIVGFAIIVFLSYFMFGIMTQYPQYASAFCIINMGLITAYLYFVTIKGKLSPEIYKLKKIEESVEKQDARAVTPSAENHELTALADKIIHLFEEEKFFKTEGVTIKELADRLDTPSYIVSQSINTVLGKSFFDLTNAYRVEEVKRLLKDPEFDRFSLVAIGFEAGFNSKTAFNTVFKKYTGMTPSEYKKQAMEMAA